jgi:hypothetical protein
LAEDKNGYLHADSHNILNVCQLLNVNKAMTNVRLLLGLIKSHDMKRYRGVHLYASLTSTLGACEWSVSHLTHFTPQTKNPNVPGGLSPYSDELRVGFPARKETFLFSSVHNGSGVHPAS